MGMPEEQIISEEWAENNPLTAKRWEDYGFELADISPYGLYDISASKAEEMGFSKTSDGVYITYPDDKDSRIRYYRSGFQAQTDIGKYGQRYGTLPAAYWPATAPYDEWADDSSVPVLLTEGEFKAIVVDKVANSPGQLNVVPIGLGGVFNWQSKKLGVDLLPSLKSVRWLGRKVWIAFDMDQGNNPMVALALSRLFNKLAELGAMCSVLSWDAARGKGIDDYLCQCPLRRAAWLELCATAQVPVHILSVLEMNKRFAYVEREQKVWDGQNNTYVAVKNFGNEFFTEKIKVQTSVKQTAQGVVPVMKEMGIGAYWLSSPLRSKVAGLQFTPGAGSFVEVEALFGEHSVKYLNTWRGWGLGIDGRMLKPKAGNVKPFYDFIYATFANESKEHCEYLIKRLAWIFQQPTVKHPTWIYLIGPPMQGKSSLIKLIAELIGQTYVSNIDESSLKSSFSEWRAEKLLVTLDDSAIKDRHVVRQLVKRLTTEEHSQVNKKYQSEYTAQNYTTFFFAANGLDALLEHDDRRALVLAAECSWDFKKGEWTEFDTWRRSAEGKAALLHHLLHEVKLDAGFLTETPPHTQARELVIESGASSWEEFLYNFSTTMAPIVWHAPASGEVRKWRPTIVTLDMMRVLYHLTSPLEDRFEIKNGALGAKLARFAARRVVPCDSTDSRGRMLILDRQIALWTWDKTWVNRTKEDYVQEYLAIIRKYPELDTGPLKKGGKF